LQNHILIEADKLKDINQ